MSASVRGLIAKNATGSANIFRTVSAANGTDPINNEGRSRITSRISIFQQSPTAGREPTSATSLHHRETPTRERPAPNSSKIEVTLGANETIRNSPRFFIRAIATRFYYGAFVSSRPKDLCSVPVFSALSAFLC